MLIALYNTIAIPLIFVAIGLTLGALASLVNHILSSVFGSMVFRSWGTIFLPGILMHEISHAIFLFATGAKIDEIVVRADSRHPWTLYRARGVKRSRSPMSHHAGYVSFHMRGPFVLQSFQRVIGSIAPTIVGLVCSVGLISMLMKDGNTWWQYAIYIYLLICVLNGSSMSTTDVKNMLPGLPVCLVALYAILLGTQLNLFTLCPTIKALLPGFDIMV